MGPEHDLASWVQAGGAVAFAAAVWWEVRELRRAFTRIVAALARSGVITDEDLVSGPGESR